MAAPVIGITAGELVASYGVWTENASIVPADYVHVVARAGGVPIVLPPSPSAAETLVGRIDGLLLTGGVDMDAELYGQPRHPKAQQPDPARDHFELALLDAAEARGVPVLGVCRGIQVVNVWRGGTLHQHLPDVVHHREHMAVPGSYTDHPVRVAEESLLKSILGRSEVEVPGHHHQAPDRIGTGLSACAWANDGTVEALEDPDRRFLVAVQWHPEVGEDPSLFDALIAAARQVSGNGEDALSRVDGHRVAQPAD